jgi:hypothetical protein
MKIKVFNRTNSQLVREGQVTIRMNTKTGMISFSKATCMNIGLKDNSKVLFIQDEDNPKDWYITPTKLEDGLVCKYRMKEDQHYETTTVQSTHICREIAAACNISVTSFSFLIAKVPIETNNMRMFAIITKSVNTILRKK